MVTGGGGGELQKGTGEQQISAKTQSRAEYLLSTFCAVRLKRRSSKNVLRFSFVLRLDGGGLSAQFFDMSPCSIQSSIDPCRSHGTGAWLVLRRILAGLMACGMLDLASMENAQAAVVDTNHWAYRPVGNPVPPWSADSSHTDIDRFIVAALQSRGLSLSQPASRADWTAGRSKPTKTPIIAITTSSSTRVKPCDLRTLYAIAMNPLMRRERSHVCFLAMAASTFKLI